MTPEDHVVVVHVLGEADLNEDSSIHKAAGVPDTDRRANLVRKVAQLRQTLASGDEHAVREFLRLESPTRGRTPLAKVLDRTDLASQVTLLLIATSTPGGIPTQDMADAFRATFTAHPGVHARTVADVSIVTVPDLADATIADGVLASLTDLEHPAVDNQDPRPVRVEVSWTGGNALLYPTLSATILSRLPWTIVPLESDQPPVDMWPPASLDRSVSWLLRYGFPGTAAAVLGSPDPATPAGRVHAVARISQRHLDDAAHGNPDTEALAEVLRGDLMRGERTAGIAARAWIRETFRAKLQTEEHCGLDGIDVYTLLDDTKTPNSQNHPSAALVRDVYKKGLACVLRSARRAEKGYTSTLAPAEIDALDRRIAAMAQRPSVQWLQFAKKYNTPAAKSSHHFVPLQPGLAAELAALVDEHHPNPWHSRPDIGPFAMPTGRVAFLSSPGAPEQGTVLDSSLTRPIGEELRSHLARGPEHPDPPVAKILLAVTADTATYAKTEKARAATWRQDTVTAHSPFTVHSPDLTHLTPEEIPHATAIIRTKTLEWLHRGTGFDAIVIIPTGMKQVILGQLQAAAEYGTRRAVPVLVQRTDFTPGPATYHSILGHLGQDQILLELATRALHRLAFDTAAVLLTAGSDTCRPLARQVHDLGTRFFAPTSHDARARLEVCADRLDKLGTDQNSHADRMKIIHIAASIVANYKGRKRSERLLVQLRHELPLNHGHTDINTAVRAAYRDTNCPQPAHWPSATAMVRNAAQANPEDRSSTFKQDYHDLYTNLHEAEEDARERATRAALSNISARDLDPTD